MARKKKPEEGSAGAYWMDTYGDMITLVLTFFVLLFSFSTIDAAKWEALVASLSGSPVAMVSPLDPGGSVAPEEEDQKLEEYESEQQKELDAAFTEFYEKAIQYREDNDLQSLLMIEMLDDTVLLRIMDSMLFDSGKATLRPEAQAILLDLVDLFEENVQYFKLINVEGHSDNRPINTYQFPDNWVLSAVRASSVVNFFGEHTDIPKHMFKLSGYAEYHPIDTNETDAGRARNRRVDIVVEKREIAADAEPQLPAADDLMPLPTASLPPIEDRVQDLWDDE